MSAVPSNDGLRASLELYKSLPRIPPPPYRHAAPSGPWPWMDLDSVSESDPGWTGNAPYTCSHGLDCNSCWARYPQSLFPNWTPSQVRRCGMKNKISGSHTSVLHYVDVHNDGHFVNSGHYYVSQAQSDELWSQMTTARPENLRVRVLCVENLSVPVMQMLGTRHNIEPFFFSSSLNWIPSRYQETARPARGDHITVTLTFIRPMKAHVTAAPNSNIHSPELSAKSHAIDTQLPLVLRSDGEEQQDCLILALDLLAVHMVRTPGNSTIISYHPSHDRRDGPQRHTSAKDLHSRIALAGESVYWQNIFKKTEDPTLVLLIMLWYALYAWDEALEMLWDHICRLESSMIETSDMQFTRELYEIRAHLLHYSSLLDDFSKSVKFVLKTPNPAMDASVYDAKARQTSRALLENECKNLLMEIDRLSVTRDMQDRRLKNVMDLVFSSVNIEDSRRMQSLTAATVRDSQSMKQISYLTMVFLPATVCSGIFGMNIDDFNPKAPGHLWHFFVVAISLTIIATWVVVAFQDKWRAEDTKRERSIWFRLLWPSIIIKHIYPGLRDRPMRSPATNTGRGNRTAVMNEVATNRDNTI